MQTVSSDSADKWQLSSRIEPFASRVFGTRQTSAAPHECFDRMGGTVQPLFGSKVWDGGPKWESVNYAKMRTPVLSPKLVRMSDRSGAECIANVVTCIPFFAAAVWTARKRDLHPRDRAQVAAGLTSVGVAATLYHMANDSPRWRNLARRFDYMSIGFNALCFSDATLHARTPCTLKQTTNHATGPVETPKGSGNNGTMRKTLGFSISSSDLPKNSTVFSAAVLPFQPLLVASTHLLMSETRLLAHVLPKKEFRRDAAKHLGLLAAAATSYTVDGILLDLPYLHAAWHVLVTSWAVSGVELACKSKMLRPPPLARQ